MPTKTSKVSYVRPVKQEYQTDSNPLVVEDNFVLFTQLESSFTGVSNPAYKFQIENKMNATTIASGVKRDFIDPSLTQFIKWKEGSGTTSRWKHGSFTLDELTEPPVSPDSIDDVVRNTALSRFLRNAKGVQRQFQGGVFLGELRQSIQLIRHPLKGIRELLSKYADGARRGRRLRGADITKHLSQQWLEFSFGALPLISDVENACSAIVRLQNKRFCAPVRGFYTASKLLDPYSVIKDLYAGRHRIERYISYTSSRLIKGEVYCQSNGDSAEVRQSLGFTVRDFIPTVYELIPYSFLVDYFTNLGEIIESWSFCQGDIAWHCDTFRREGLTDVRVIPIVPKTFFGQPVVASSMTPGRSFYRVRSFSRVSEPLGLPSLGFKLPNTSTKFLNIAALASMRVL